MSQSLALIDEPVTRSASVVPASILWTRALQRTADIRDDQAMTLADVVDAHAAHNPDAPALVSDAGSLSYGALSRRSNQYARWALAQGLRPGDTICLMLANSPDYLAIWLGLSRVGVVAALLNTQISGASLSHCIAVAAPKAAVVGAEFVETYEETKPSHPVWTHGASPLGEAILPTVDALSDAALEADTKPTVSLRERALLIYTSGTTGLPKAANVSHYRIRMWSEWFAGLMDATPDDRLYNCLPMYHSIGGVAAAGSMLAAGASVAIREKFSASAFWDDVVKYDCTVFQYIGELCRYLLSRPENALERRHRLRLACGNGLRADIWEAFEKRFAIPRILEFYAATEGSFSLFNVEGQTGAIGKIPGFMSHRSPIAIVRYDSATGQPQRTDDGFCLRCAADEPGEAIGRIVEGGSGLSTRFEGYTSQAESERKILRNVFEPGDAWFRTGDLMRKDRKGFYYFVDRTGDTFRWKGENVATLEVEAALSRFPGISEAIVYGVGIPGQDGKAGMAAITIDPSFCIEPLSAFLKERLPAYARPLFIRICGQIAVTGTFKHQKQGLAQAGFDPAKVTDTLYVRDAADDNYVPLTTELFAKISAGSMRL